MSAGVHRRKARHSAHQAFDAVWRAGIMSRTEAYRRIGDMLGLPASRSHLGVLTRSQLSRVTSWAKAIFARRLSGEREP